MDQIIWEIQSLQIEGTPQERTAFANLKRNFLVKLRKEEMEIIKELHDHAKKHFIHSIRVAHDVNYIARNIANFSKDQVTALTIAAILHDVGKVDMHEIILNLGDYRERAEIYRQANPGRPVPKGPLLREITLNDIIRYKAKKARDPHSYIQSFHEWLKKRGETNYLGRSLQSYIRTHQLATRKILTRIGVSPRIIEYAASHHPEYFTDIYKRRIPPECQVLAIADKFNAIIQSEGRRHYANAETRITAIGILLMVLDREFPRTSMLKLWNPNIRRARQIANVSIYLLAKKYLPQELRYLVPRAAELNKRLTGFPQEKVSKKDMQAAKKAFIEINYAIAVLKRFRLTDDFRNLIRQLLRQRRIMSRKVPGLHDAA
jgi:hypothetical protein